MNTTLIPTNSNDLRVIKERQEHQKNQIQLNASQSLSPSGSPSSGSTKVITGLASIAPDVSPSDTFTSASPASINSNSNLNLSGQNLLESIHNETESYSFQVLSALGCGVTTLSLSGAVLAGGVIWSSSLLAYHYIYREPTENVFFPQPGTLFIDFVSGFSARAYLELGWNRYVESNENNDSNKFVKDLLLIGLFLAYQLNINNDHNQPENIPQNLSQFIDLAMFAAGSATSSIGIRSSGYFATFFTDRQNTDNHCRKIRSDIAFGLTTFGLISFIAVAVNEYFSKIDSSEQSPLENTPINSENIDLCNDPKNFGVCLID